MNKKKKIIFYIITITVLSMLITVIINKMIMNPELYIETITKKHISLIASYIGLCFIQTLLPIIPGEPIELLGGYLFGVINGTIICLICEALASIIIVLVSKQYGKKIISYLFEDIKIKILDFFKNKKRFNLFAILFILPGTPKDLLCYLSGLTDYDLIPTLIIVTIGRIPSVASSTISASLFKDDKYIVSAIVYIVTLLICFIDILIYKKIIANKKND